MTIEIQIRESSLGQAFAEFVQTQLFTMCVPANLPGLYVDHLDTVPGSLIFADVPGGGVKISLKVAIYVVSQADVGAHPNGEPDGATQVFGEIGVVVRLAMVGTALTIISAESDTSGLPPPPALQAVVKAAIDSSLSQLNGRTLFETAPIVTALSAIVPAAPDLSRGQGVVAMRFGTIGPVISQLATAQAWGAFLDATEASGLLARRLPDEIDVDWQPNGSTPAMSLGFNFDFSPLGIDVAGITAVGTGSVRLLSPSTLKLSVSWGIDLRGVLAPFEALARKLAREFVRAKVRSLIPQATHDGAQSFFFTINLPPIPAFLGAQPLWGSISSSPAGMTIGGPVIPAPMGSRETVYISVGRFDRPVWWGRCREQARIGDGSAPAVFADWELKVKGGANVTDAGALCSVEIQPPNQWLLANMSSGTEGIGFNLTVGVAELITSDVHILLRTARGTRFVDLGRPLITRGEDGRVTNVQVNILPDCLTLSGAWLKLALGEQLTVADFRPPPFEDPNWMKTLGVELGLNSHLVTIAGLDPGEMVTLRGPGLWLDVTADEAGTATVPALVGLSPVMHEVIVTRVSGRPLPRAIRVQTTEFTWLAAVGAADAAAVRDVDGRARIARRLGKSVVVEDYRADDLQRIVRIEGHDETALNPQPLPPGPPDDAARLARDVKLEDVATVQTLPGNNGRSLALVQMHDGTRLIVTADGKVPRVAGCYSGPLVGMLVDGGYAIAKSGDMVHLFAMHRPEVSNCT
jgi:hypothetical protein